MLSSRIWRAQSAVKFEETRPCFVCHKYVLVLMQFFMIVEGESEKQFKLRKLPRFLKLQVKGGRRNILKPNFCAWSSFTISMIICLHFSIQCFNSLFMVCPEGTWKFIESLLIYNYVWGLTSHFKADQRSIKKCFIWRVFSWTNHSEQQMSYLSSHLLWSQSLFSVSTFQC